MASIGRSSTYIAVVDVLKELGGDAGPVAHEVVHGGKHAKVKFVVKGIPFSVVVSNTPSDNRAYANSRKCVKRLLRERGINL